MPYLAASGNDKAELDFAHDSWTADCDYAPVQVSEVLTLCGVLCVPY
jgi:hypothetical protein